MNSIKQIMPDEAKNYIKEYQKLASRYYRYGSIDIVNQKGRKKVSPEHKKNTYKIWYEKQKQAKLDAGILPKKAGRPKKIIA